MSTFLSPDTHDALQALADAAGRLHTAVATVESSHNDETGSTTAMSLVPTRQNSARAGDPKARIKEQELQVGDEITVYLFNAWRRGRITNIKSTEDATARIFTIEYTNGKVHEDLLRGFHWRPAAGSRLYHRFTDSKASATEFEDRFVMSARSAEKRTRAAPERFVAAPADGRVNRSPKQPEDAVKLNTRVDAFCDIEQKWCDAKILGYKLGVGGWEACVHFMGYSGRHDTLVSWDTHVRQQTSPPKRRRMDIKRPAELQVPPRDQEDTEGIVEQVGTSVIVQGVESPYEPPWLSNAEDMVRSARFDPEVVASQMRRAAGKAGVKITLRDFISLYEASRGLDRGFLEAVQDELGL